MERCKGVTECDRPALGRGSRLGVFPFISDLKGLKAELLVMVWSCMVKWASLPAVLGALRRAWRRMKFVAFLMNRENGSKTTVLLVFTYKHVPCLHSCFLWFHSQILKRSWKGSEDFSENVKVSCLQYLQGLACKRDIRQVIVQCLMANPLPEARFLLVCWWNKQWTSAQSLLSYISISLFKLIWMCFYQLYKGQT